MVRCRFAHIAQSLVKKFVVSISKIMALQILVIICVGYLIIEESNPAHAQEVKTKPVGTKQVINKRFGIKIRIPVDWTAKQTQSSGELKIDLRRNKKSNFCELTVGKFISDDTIFYNKELFLSIFTEETIK